MYLTELFIIFTFAPLIWLWLDAMKIKEAVRHKAAILCKQNHVQFLDDTVQLSRFTIDRQAFWQLRLKRVYSFEFTNNESIRYHGHIIVIGRSIVETYMDAYRIDAYD